ncbi:MAG TPA: aspartate kinase [Planctomycetaceae bacterium]|nr:aspartate kinase [Planctomycetaceae bacterium]
MGLIVQKFGGTSVADCEKILAAARKAIRAQQDGDHVVMVVSAMGKNTDMLVDLAQQVSERPPAREMDMLLSTGEQVSVALMAMAVDALGHRAVSLTGAQIGIRTDSTHTKARILSISTDRVRDLLNEGNIVIAAGFQGIDENFDITTLGRGGSDTTAVALAAVLSADACEIFTDVDGVYTTDPRVLPEARRVSQISYDEMLELASLGAGVMHNRSIEFAKKFGVPIHVRSSMSDIPGSMILDGTESDDQPVCGAAITRDEARITLIGLPDVPGTSLVVFDAIAEQNVTVDMIVQNVGENSEADISFTVPRNELDVTLIAVNKVLPSLGENVRLTHSDDVSKVSVVGLGMARQHGVANRMFKALSDAMINIQMITTSEIKISVLVERAQAMDALRAVHRAFSLEKVTCNVVPTKERQPRTELNPADVATRLQKMEDLVINDVTMDDSQGRITIVGVRDEPGVAAHVFNQVAEAGIFVDMIVQSYDGQDGQASLSFTVPRNSFDVAEATSRELAKEFGCQAVTSNPCVAKLSVSGIGLRSHTGVAIRMFRCLAEIGVNVVMINTSEIRVNVVVDGDEGERALDALQNAFADALG